MSATRNVPKVSAGIGAESARDDRIIVQLGLPVPRHAANGGMIGVHAPFCGVRHASLEMPEMLMLPEMRYGTIARSSTRTVRVQSATDSKGAVMQAMNQRNNRASE
jgi:hypothetical protein